MVDMEVSVTTRMRWMMAVRRQQMVHHLTGTGSMQYMLNMMKRLYHTIESPYSGRPLREYPNQKRAQPEETRLIIGTTPFDDVINWMLFVCVACCFH